MAFRCRPLQPLRHLRLSSAPALPLHHSHRTVHIQATPFTSSIDGVLDLSDQTQSIPKLSGEGPFPADTQFEVLGAPYSLLSVSLPASSILYSRRGSLVGLNGDVTHASSSLSLYSPLSHALLRIPFLYQKLSSPKPLTALLTTSSPNTTFGILSLDGKVDWQLCQRTALLAWSGYTISVRPSFSPRLSNPAFWGTSRLTGRGLVALVGKGQIYQAVLGKGETFVVHPQALLAYSHTSPDKKPTPFRLHSSQFRLQVPKLRLEGWGKQLRDVEFVRKVMDSEAYKVLVRAAWEARMWVRRTIWGDRLFLKFEGPGTILLQSRSGRLKDLVASEDVAELAGMQPSGTSKAQRMTQSLAAVEAKINKVGQETTALALAIVESSKAQRSPAALRKVTVDNGKVTFEDSDFKEFTQRK